MIPSHKILNLFTLILVSSYGSYPTTTIAQEKNRVFQMRFWLAEMQQPGEKGRIDSSHPLYDKKRVDKWGNYHWIDHSKDSAHKEMKDCYTTQLSELTSNTLTDPDSLSFLDEHKIQKIEIEVIRVRPMQSQLNVLLRNQKERPVSISGDVLRIRALMNHHHQCVITSSDRINKSFLQVIQLEERVEKWQSSITTKNQSRFN